MRVGIGYDAHRFIEGRPLILGGVGISHHLGLGGHSDADVLTHAIIDAILGAIGEGDIGSHFPDTSDKYKGICSLDLLSDITELMFSKGYKIVNLDATVILQEPKLAPYWGKMKEKISKILKVNKSQINFKATTTEGMGFTGRCEGIAAQAIALLKEK
ncbi:2-C-methyl-D-erythritol 2,4-cyclodiphosphate synthase [Candidatus Oleimmundimicrobium sp.]|uniref:2-C-methyl-D-erythritol 2,4-cyclodiphosphate synthase n=1 Tax=Candidatus Oleimmundimicrobium sp. TaxID=3060597 RepID=UPI002715E1CF|nr:2-C-methyl-D-erythritol 2,4-cyclodiphosphate synthase [Candidatus Oleimmundimicrobium sp.]MDO8885978.1 2-C-methyl-D-erythritol 2,4-cyclodiphosphate synthase [Candidatus Oleimmundimicrobium sp.]